MSIAFGRYHYCLVRTAISASRPRLATYGRSQACRWLPAIHQQPFFSQRQYASAAAEGVPSIKEKLPESGRLSTRFREFDLQDKVMVVTGGARGLGLTLAEALVEAGGKGE